MITMPRAHRGLRMRPGRQEHVQAGGRVDGCPGRHAHRRRRGVQPEVVATHQHRQRDDRLEQRKLVACAVILWSIGFDIRSQNDMTFRECRLRLAELLAVTARVWHRRKISDWRALPR